MFSFVFSDGKELCEFEFFKVDLELFVKFELRKNRLSGRGWTFEADGSTTARTFPFFKTKWKLRQKRLTERIRSSIFVFFSIFSSIRKNFCRTFKPKRTSPKKTETNSRQLVRRSTDFNSIRRFTVDLSFEQVSFCSSQSMDSNSLVLHHRNFRTFHFSENRRTICKREIFFCHNFQLNERRFYWFSLVDTYSLEHVFDLNHEMSSKRVSF